MRSNAQSTSSREITSGGANLDHVFMGLLAQEPFVHERLTVWMGRLVQFQPDEQTTTADIHDVGIVEAEIPVMVRPWKLSRQTMISCRSVRASRSPVTPTGSYAVTDSRYRLAEQPAVAIRIWVNRDP